MKKKVYYFVQVVHARSEQEAIEKVEKQELDKRSHCDTLMTKERLWRHLSPTPLKDILSVFTPKTLLSKKSVRTYYQELDSAGYLTHPEDSLDTIVWNMKKPTKKQLAQMTANQKKIWELAKKLRFDPCEIALKVIR